MCLCNSWERVSSSFGIENTQSQEDIIKCCGAIMLKFVGFLSIVNFQHCYENENSLLPVKQSQIKNPNFFTRLVFSLLGRFKFEHCTNCILQ